MDTIGSIIINNDLIAYLTLAACVLILCLGLYIKSARYKGASGERKVDRTLRRYLNKREYRLFKDLTLPTADGTTQIDHIVLSRFGVFVIETKNMSGWIFGDADQKKWTQSFRRHKFTFQNPILQNYKHIKAVQEALGIEFNKVHGAVVFVGSANPKTAMPKDVFFGPKSLVMHIRSKHTPVFEEHELDRLAECLAKKALKRGFRTNRQHLSHLKAKAAIPRDVTRCPRCGAKMLERKNKTSGNCFLGCSRYPKCKGTRDL